ncbi:hypothetical protein ACQ4PT_015734 [Festuca glaucescens]
MGDRGGRPATFQRGNGRYGGGGGGHQNCGQFNGYNNNGGRGGFNNFEARSSSGPANGVGYGAAEGFQGNRFQSGNGSGNGPFKSSDGGFGGNGGYQAGFTFRGNGGQQAQGFHGFQGNVNQGENRFQGGFNVGSGFNNNAARRGNYNRGGFRYFRRDKYGHGGDRFNQGGRGAGMATAGAGRGDVVNSGIQSGGTGLVQQSQVLNVDVQMQGDQGATLGTPDVLVQPAIAQSSQGGGLPVSVVNHVESPKVQNNQEADLAAKAQGKKAKKNDKLNCRRILDRMNVLVVDGFYDLSFEVEIPEGDEEMEDASLDNNGPPNDDQNKDSHSKESEDHKSADGEKNSTDNSLAKDPKVSETRGSQQQTMGKGSVTTLSGISPSSRVRYSPLVQ